MTNKNISGQVAWGIIIAFLVILAVIFIGPILFAALVVSGITMESKSFWVLVVLVVAAIGAIYQEHQNKVEGEILAQRRHEYELEHMKAMSVIEKAYPAKPRIQIDEFAASKAQEHIEAQNEEIIKEVNRRVANDSKPIESTNSISEDTEKLTHGIIIRDGKYCYGEYKYDKLVDAIAYAKLVEGKK